MMDGKRESNPKRSTIIDSSFSVSSTQHENRNSIHKPRDIGDDFQLVDQVIKVVKKDWNSILKENVNNMIMIIFLE